MKLIILCFCFSLIMMSCTESAEIENENNQPDDNFYALSVGNSWVYKNYRLDFNTDTYKYTGGVDSISIIDKKNIDGITYYEFRRLTTGIEDGSFSCYSNGEYFKLLRENDGALVDDEGNVIFTNDNFQERLLYENSWGNVYERLVEGDTIMNVEAGEFKCIYSERYAIDTEGQRLEGTNHYYYSEGIGLVYETCSTVSDEKPRMIKRLDAYDIQ